MTVTATNTSSGPYTGNGSTTAFPFTFSAASAAEVAVAVDGATVSSSLYTVAVTDGGGTVTFVTAPAAGASILISSAPSFTQDSNFENNGAFLPATFNKIHDRLAITDLYLKGRIDSIPQINVADLAASALTSAGRAEAAQAASTSQSVTATGAATSASLSAAAATAISNGLLFDAAADGVSQGVVSLSITAAGSGGTNGTYPLAFSGGGGSGAEGTLTVSGGAVTGTAITRRGKGYTSNPTVSLAAATGLTGATVTAARGNYAVPDGDFYLVKGSGNAFATLYKNVGGVATTQGLDIPSVVGVQASVATLTTALQAGLAPLSVGTSVMVGRPITPGLGAAGPCGNAQLVFGDPAPADGTVTWVWFWAEATGTVNVSIWSRSGTTNTQVTTPVALTASATGLNRFAVSIPISRGQYVGFNGNGVVSTISSATTGYLDGISYYGGGTTASTSFTASATIQTTVLEFGAYIDIKKTFADRYFIKPDLDFGWNHYLASGQSFAPGAYASAPISTTPSAFHKTFNVGPKMTAPGIAGGLNADDGAVKALVEDAVKPDAIATTYGETSCFRFAAGFSNRWKGKTFPIWFASAPGVSSQSLTTLSKGWSVDYYGQAIFHVTAAKAAANVAGVSYSVPFIAKFHGETDQQLNRSKEAYRFYLDGDIDNMQADILAITGVAGATGRKVQTVPPIVLFAVPNLYITTSGNAVDAILEICDCRPDCHVVVPNYRIPQSSLSHPTDKGQALLGEYMSRAASQVADGRRPDRVKWTRVRAVGTALTAYATAPTALAINTTDYGSTTDRGIKVVDNTGTLTLSSIAIGTAVFDPATGLYETPITMTLNRTLGTNPRFRYARDYAGTGDVSAGSAGGNIFDTTAETVTLGGTTYTLNHAALPVEMPVRIAE